VAFANGQSTATLKGRVFDQAGSVVSGAAITIVNKTTGREYSAQTDDAGSYQISSLPIGIYRCNVRSPGLQTQVVENLTVEIGTTVVQDFHLRVGDISQVVTVSQNTKVIEETTTSVGHLMDQRNVQQLPLNGRYFLDLGLLVPGSVTPPQNGFAAVPVRGLGSFAINTAGNREETVNYMINGITLNDMWFNSISFQPSISSIQEFKIDNSTLNAEYGQNSGAAVNIATRSGSNGFHGELFEFLRNDAFDARNFFDLSSGNPPPFHRNQFGASIGGPIVKNKAFFLFTYEGVRHRQGVSLNGVVLSDDERISTTDPVVRQLIGLIPRSNFVDSSGTPRFFGAATALVNLNHWTSDLEYDPTPRDRIHGFYTIELRSFVEPIRFGNTVPGFGNRHNSTRHLLTLSETHAFSSSSVNEVRVGFNRVSGFDTAAANFDPASFGIRDGISEPIGLPQINVAGGGLNFGGPSIFPSGRVDTRVIYSDIASHTVGRHSLKFGGELRQFFNDNIRRGTGSFNFPTIDALIAGIANSFSVTLGDQSSSITQNAVGSFVQDNFDWFPNLSLEMGLRYEWNVTPTERNNRFIVFDPRTVSLLRVGSDIDQIYHQNNKNFQPRVGFVWDPFKSGRTAVRAAYAISVDEPLTSVASGRSANPPFAIPLAFSGPIRFDNAIDLAVAAGLAPQTVDQGFDNAYLQSWNLNIQREITPSMAVMFGYFGSKGTHLTIRRNINQPVNGVRPFSSIVRVEPDPSREAAK